MKIKAYPKINLCLDIVNKRKDGYHELNSIFCLCDIFKMNTYLYDTLEITVSDEPGIKIRIPDSDLSCGQDNLIWKAARAVTEKYSIKKGVDMLLEKRIPAGAGLGGGSSDAAAVLVALNSLFALELCDEELIELGAALGADVPFFIKGGTAQVTGIGEKIQPLRDMPECALMIVKPDLSVSTAEAYLAVDKAKTYFHPDTDVVAEAINACDYEKICLNAGNSFEKVISEKYPELLKIKEALEKTDADCAVMTGSGSAFFALFKDIKASKAAAERLRNEKDISDLIGGIYV